jgi:dTDP-4-amino-4,6-dideoxygalactose transaminase
MAERVSFLDLGRRIESIRPRLEAEVGRVLARGRFILGEAGAELESEFAKYCGVDHAVGVASGTDALWLALEALGVGPGDEVVTVSNTCAPTIAAIVQSGATPVLVEVDPATLTMDPARAEAALSPRTRCILPVHLYGQCADLGALRELAERHGLFLVEDCAQAHGAECNGRRAGGVGHAGCFSFYPTKNLGALGDGGMVVTRDGALAQRLRLLRNYGYGEPNRSVMKGHNSRLDEVQAAVLLTSLDRLDEWNERRRAIAARYTAAFDGGPITPPVEAAWARHVYHLYVVRSPERNRLRQRLQARGVETMIHYPVPVHHQEGYAGLVRVGAGDLELSERLADEVLSLPLYPELTDREVDRVIDAVTGSAAPAR